MKIERYSSLRKSEVLLSPDFFSKTDILPRKAVFHYGQWKKEVDIKTDEKQQSDIMGISDAIFETFTFPDSQSYELLWDGRNLRLGPVIAFVPINKTETLEQKLDLFESYFVAQPLFSGLIFICAIDGIDTATKAVAGFYYNPENEPKWKKGVFPYPGALYRKTGFSGSLYEEMIRELGDKIFNTYFFNKWELWKWLSASDDCRRYLPETRKLKDVQDIKEMLDKHGEVYLKKIASHKAKGIIKVTRADADYSFKYRLRGKKTFDNPDAINQFIKEINKKKDYLVQQAIPVKTHDERNFDFRLIMQKNRAGKWICNGNIARFGKKHSIATNFLLDGYALTGSEALKAVFNYNDRDAFTKEQEMIQACVYICEKLDVCGGNYGDLGVDVIVDELQNIWVLEVNKLHDHRYPLYALNDEQMYYKVTTTPFEYGAYLAGF